MKYSKLVMLGLVGALTFGVVGCTNNTTTPDTTTPNTTTENTTTPENTNTGTGPANNTYKDMTLENYKNEFSNMYENNIAGLTKFEPIKVDQPTENYPGNEQYVADLKKQYEDSKKKVDEFTKTLKTVETTDPKVKEMNDKLIAESEKLSKALDTRIKKLNTVPNDLMAKSEVEFRQGLSDLLQTNETVKSDFQKFVDDTKEFFGIQTTK